ncbi:MAG: molybdopterin-binding/glycosyltransferase family 2 protein [Methylocystis sp.]|nr:molybdopterin-binding/glycosyltransferase family 2 protein [Methylocystis sp.]MCA3584270.1 molybdopterin-binding/glycosyltransferase family 2 protein [Methylocystis sp.]MCA3588302.1 molybdopterin-binding/glycosyltransferase family 2 protein [Methylocystis sp.]MCA3593422.1 molybdopterin-binding/glycosyltransferase family 2 protein [Methylocystis sp.]
MRFGPVPIRQAVGGILAHAVKEDGLLIRKGTVIGEDHVRALFAAGVAEVTVALLEGDDLTEDEAARRLASALIDVEVIAEKPFTGRVNLFAAGPGVLLIDAAKIDAVNAIDESVTVATLSHQKRVASGEMVATVKIIPFAAPAALVEQAIGVGAGAIRVAPFKAKKAAVFSTLLPGLKSSVVDKTLRVLDERLQGLGGSERLCDIRVRHTVEDLAEVLPRARAFGADITIIFGASAITDRRDVIPAALEAAGGSVVHLGMPVDPGNLLMLGTLDGRPVIGAPGCARSPKENGFDWVLERLVADLKVTSQDIRRMGVGGLLMEIISRPQPRDPEDTGRPQVAAIVLAAGQGARMGGGKMTAKLGGKALVRYPHEAAAASLAAPILTVLGHDAARVGAALLDLDTQIVGNPDYAKGMSTSLKAGIAALPLSAAGAIVLLGDMPYVTPAIINRLIAAFAAHPKAKAVVPMIGGQRGNPILIGRSLFEAVMALEGDMGARKLLDAAGGEVIEVAIDDVAVLTDVDTPEALARLEDR